MEIVPTGPARFDVPLDVAKVQTAGRWNSGFIVVGVLLFLLCLVGLSAMIASGFGSWFTFTLVGVFAVASIGLVVTSALRRRMLLLLVGRGDSACTSPTTASRSRARRRSRGATWCSSPC